MSDNKDLSAIHSITKISIPVNLPVNILDITGHSLQAITDALQVDRNVLASNDQITHAFTNLPRILSKIPPALRTAGLVRMCVAVTAGLFDSAINYAWNAAILELRNKVRIFGINIVGQVNGNNGFDENALLDLKDADLLSLCLKLNLISEDGYFMLDQCRDIRNNFSAAHPSIGDIDETELLNFLNRCAKHALSDQKSLKGVDIHDLIQKVKFMRFSAQQLSVWKDRIDGTFDAQKEAIVGILHGIYCDPASGEESRSNALSICKDIKNTWTPKIKSELIDRHYDYMAKGDTERHKASQIFFQKIGMMQLLSEPERHTLITSACSKLMSIHQAFDNFYNEPPFAQRLETLTRDSQVPYTAQHVYVETVITCAVGNPYGTSHAALPFYQRMIRSFSPNEIQIMLKLATERTAFRSRIHENARCMNELKNILGLISLDSIPTDVQQTYNKLIKS
ncbi:MAG: hypothetical protein HQM03_18205 [Magnetococcales bacterium]|nr:hypothetical protein [Magnetococcales bacterium]